MTNELPTIKLKGKDYVQVKDRVLFFNEEYPNGSIVTEVIERDGYASFKAIVTPDTDKPTRYFIGRSAGVVSGDKSYEKLETVSVGRALAFMGIGVIESIASADEIINYEERKVAPKVYPKSVQPEGEPVMQEGDTLVKGVSQKSGKPWWAIQRGKEKIWLTQSQYNYIMKQVSDAPLVPEEGLPF